MKLSIQGTVYKSHASRGRKIVGPGKPTFEEAVRAFRDKMLKAGIGYEPVFVLKAVDLETRNETVYNDADQNKATLDLFRAAGIKVGLDA